MKNFDITDLDFKDLNRMTENLVKVLTMGFDLAAQRGGTDLVPKDLFIAMIMHRENIAGRLLERLGMDLSETQRSLLENYDQEEAGALDLEIHFGEEARDLLTRAFLLASELGHVYVGTEHLLLAILQLQKEDYVREMAGNGLTFDFVKQAMLNFGIYQPGVFADSGEEEEGEDRKDNIYFFARNMNEQAEQGKYLKVWGRDAEIERMIHILSRKTKNNPIIVGEAGVGKTAIVEGLVQRILEGRVPESFRNKTIIQLDLSAILAGSKIRGDVEERLLSIISDLERHPDWIVFIDEIHMIVGAGAAGSSGSMDIANMLKPHLTSGNIRVIGATTFNEYQKYIEDDPALERRFQSIMVDELSVEDSYKVLHLLKPQFEKYHDLKISSEALEAAVELADRYITNKYLPDKAIDVLDEAAAGKRIVSEKSGKKVRSYEQELAKISIRKEKALEGGNMKEASEFRDQEMELERKINQADKAKGKRRKSKRLVVTAEDIRKVIARWSKVPVTTMKRDDVKKLKDLDKNLHKRIMGQDDAIERVASALKRARLDIADETRPMASFLFLGPTGVGKTETAKEIARTYFGDERALIQVDMSEFMEQHSVSKLIGSPPGYVGYQEGGQLTEKVRRRPYSVVLFDEIEKAHPDLLNILLQILEEGNLQDSKGRRVNFKNTIIIMTSNIGASDIGKDDVLGFGVDIENERSGKVDQAFEKMQEKLLSELKDTLPPEFINRIDDVVIFRGLDQEDMHEIAKLLISEMQERMKKKGLLIKLTPAVIKYVAEEGYDEEYGARNIRRKIQELVENPIADYILDKNIILSKDKEYDLKIEKKGKKLRIG